MRVRAAGILQKDASLLLIKHHKEGKEYWLLPGGGISAGERIHEALKRELKEELNLDIEVNELQFVVETISHDGIHIIQPTFSIEVKDLDAIKVGFDKRVVSFDFFTLSTINDVIIYPDIGDELREFLRLKKISCNYIFKKWID